MSDRSEFGSFLLGFLVGGLTGAVVSLLLAPQSGEETRAVIKDKAIELAEQASETAEDAYTKAEAAANEAMAKADELSKVAKERADELSRKGQVVLEEQKARVTEAVNTTAKKVKSVKVEPPAGTPPADAA
jgi:gas vesicle protein